ncbi:uncharacterized protein TNCV_1628141 [Trichonephila clavipes]|nr:uncharacterized protein TNCV_1628141 [Trichonephila clavipes]
MITNFFIPELNNHDVQELWFQQDGATCHTARATIDLLKDTFGDRLISRFGPVNWPPRSCDLTPLDYFLWGYVKSLVYADKPQTLDHLEDNIRRVIAIYGHKCWKKSSKIGRPDWTTSEPAVAVLCQKSYLKSNILSCGSLLGSLLKARLNEIDSSTLISWAFYIINSFGSLTAILWIAGGVPLALDRLKDEYFKKAHQKMLIVPIPEEPKLEKWLFDRPDFVLTEVVLTAFPSSSLIERGFCAVKNLITKTKKKEVKKEKRERGARSWMEKREKPPALDGEGTRGEPCLERTAFRCRLNAAFIRSNPALTATTTAQHLSNTIAVLTSFAALPIAC